MSTTIYLYLKTHKISGLKYFGQTSSDPYKYIGSGHIWKKHLKKYGKEDIHTEIIAECKSQEEVRELGLYYSELWNIVESKEFANLREESGQGAVPGSTVSQSTREKISETLKRNGNAGHSGLKGKNNPMYGSCRLGHTAQKVLYKDVIYKSCRDCAKSNGVTPAMVSYWIRKGTAEKIMGNDDNDL